MSSNSLLSPPDDVAAPSLVVVEKDDDEKDSKLWNDIVSAFREDGFPNLSNVNGAIREELLSLYRLSSEDDNAPSKFVIAWEAFASNAADIKDDVKSIPNAENIESFREYILKEVASKEIMRVVGSRKNATMKGGEESKKKKKKLSKFEKQAQKKARLMTMGEHLEMHDEDVDGKMEVVTKEEDSAEEPLLKTPFKETTSNSMNLLPSASVEMKTPGSYRKAKKKTSSSESTLVKTIFEGSLSSSSNAEEKLSPEITLKLIDSTSPTTLFMRDRIEDKVALLKNKFKEEEEEEQEEEEQKEQGQIIGRVCCDSSDRQELQLESSDGSRVKLELRSVENEYSLFPGQIVKCVGANPTGYCFVAKEIDCYYFKQQQQQQQQQQQIKEEVQTEMLIFSGPFTANDDLMYEPLDDVLHEASSKNPSIVLLMGPFVSDENINHALTSNITYKQAFEQIVMKKVEAFAKQYPNKHVVLVPSVKDAFHRYCAFPQPPFFETSKCKNVHFVANPSAFEVNGIRVAVSTCDILKHLSGFERGGKGKTTTEQQQTDRMTRLCSHMVGQMSMYPLFPPHPDAKFESHDATVPLRVGMDERVPDLIVLTSDLAAGGWKNALSGNKTMFVNPGKVCRGVNAGTFCKISSSGEKFAESARLELHKL